MRISLESTTKFHKLPKIFDIFSRSAKKRCQNDEGGIFIFVTQLLDTPLKTKHKTAQKTHQICDISRSHILNKQKTVFSALPHDFSYCQSPSNIEQIISHLISHSTLLYDTIYVTFICSIYCLFCVLF